METSNTQKKGKDMSIWIILGVIAVWILLQAYILPKMGISTWMSNSCQVGDKQPKAIDIIDKTK